MDIMRRRPRLGVQVFTNPEVRVYHATTRLADNRHYGTIVFGRDRHYEESDELSDRDKHLIDTLYDATHGVNVVGLGPCSVSIDKGYAFDWDEIEDLIIDVILAHLGWNRKDVEIEQPAKPEQQAPHIFAIVSGELDRFEKQEREQHNE